MLKNKRINAVLFANIVFYLWSMFFSSLYAQNYIDKIITSVKIKGTREMITKLLTSNIQMKKGKVFAAEMTTKDTKTLMNNGYFSKLGMQFKKNYRGKDIKYEVETNNIIKKIVFIGNTVYNEQTLFKLLNLPLGKILNITELQEGIKDLIKKYQDEGYILAKISNVKFDEDGVLTIKIAEGIIEKINIKGNTKTKNYVIERELRFKEGEPFNKDRYARSYERLTNLMIFKAGSIFITYFPGSLPDQVEIDIKVQEGTTGLVSIGGGLSIGGTKSWLNFFANVSIEENNLYGTGDQIKTSFAIGGSDLANTNKFITYMSPYLDKQGTIGISYFRNVYEKHSSKTDMGDSTKPDGYKVIRATYNIKETGMSVGFGKMIGEYERYNLSVNLNNCQYKGGAEKTYENFYLIDEKGNHIGSPNPYYGYINKNFGLNNTVILSRYYDSRFPLINTIKGIYQSLNLETSGLLGGDFGYQKITGEIKYYSPIYKKTTLAMWLKLGHMYGLFGKDIPETSSYCLGGSETLRGYKTGQFAGSSVFFSTIEYRIPIVSNILSFALFTDIGQIWAKNRIYNPLYGPVPGPHSNGMIADYGVSARVTTPIGQLKFDLGRPYSKKDWFLENIAGWQFYFSLGNSF